MTETLVLQRNDQVIVSTPPSTLDIEQLFLDARTALSSEDLPRPDQVTFRHVSMDTKSSYTIGFVFPNSTLATIAIFVSDIPGNDQISFSRTLRSGDAKNILDKPTWLFKDYVVPPDNQHAYWRITKTRNEPLGWAPKSDVISPDPEDNYKRISALPGWALDSMRALLIAFPAAKEGNLGLIYDSLMKKSNQVAPTWGAALQALSARTFGTSFRPAGLTPTVSADQPTPP